MGLKRLLLPAVFAALFPLAGSALFAPPPAAAYNSFGVDESEEAPGSALQDLLKTRGELVLKIVVVGMGLVFVLILGPGNVLDAWQRNRRSRYGGFGSNGGFGGRLF
ncbi:MAG TPA: hypothetical protein PKI19_00980 [Elusimicrobiales bacterium]|nr:hypothetical protein [Elusimicrobiales bacterium]